MANGFGFTKVGVTQLKALNGRLFGLTDVENLTPEVVKSGVEYAKRIAPQDTGALKRAIHGRYGRKNAGVYVKTPDHSDGRKRPYMLWHHGFGIYNQVRSGPTRPTSGKGDFLFATSRYLKRIAKERFTKRITQKLKQNG
jgi:hypothetical protein